MSMYDRVHFPKYSYFATVHEFEPTQIAYERVINESYPHFENAEITIDEMKFYGERCRCENIVEHYSSVLKAEGDSITFLKSGCFMKYEPVNYVPGFCEKAIMTVTFNYTSYTRYDSVIFTPHPKIYTSFGGEFKYWEEGANFTAIMEGPDLLVNQRFGGERRTKFAILYESWEIYAVHIYMIYRPASLISSSKLLLVQTPKMDGERVKVTRGTYVTENANSMIKTSMFIGGIRGEDECTGSVTVAQRVLHRNNFFLRQLVLTCSDGIGHMVTIECAPKRCQYTGSTLGKSYYTVRRGVETYSYKSKGIRRTVRISTISMHDVHPEIDTSRHQEPRWVKVVEEWMGRGWQDIAKAIGLIYLLAEKVVRYAPVILAVVITAYVPTPHAIRVAIIAASFYVPAIADDGTMEPEKPIQLVCSFFVFPCLMILIPTARDAKEWMAIHALTQQTEVGVIPSMALWMAFEWIRRGRLDHRLIVGALAYNTGFFGAIFHFALMTPWAMRYVDDKLRNVQEEMIEQFPQLSPGSLEDFSLARWWTLQSPRYHGAGVYTGFLNYITTTLPSLRIASVRKRIARKRRVIWSTHRRHNLKGMVGYLLYPEEYYIMKPYLSKMPEAFFREAYATLESVITRRKWDLAQLENLARRFETNFIHMYQPP